ncbi:MAG: RadC family protein [Bacillota bacterium]
MLLIKELPLGERPRERLIHYGREALSIQELIAIILRTGSREQSVVALAQDIFRQCESVRALNQLTFKELTNIRGIGPAKAVQLLAALELGKRMIEEPYKDSIQLMRPEMVYDFMKVEVEMETQEKFYALYLDTKACLIKKHLLFVGSLSSSLVHPRELFKHAVRLSAASIIIVHNHPSGDPAPSRSDKSITKTMMESGKLMDIEVIDHIIIGKGRFYSFKAHQAM